MCTTTIMMDQVAHAADTSVPLSIPFSFFVSLLSEISKIRPKSRPAQNSSNTYTALQTFERWIVELHRRFGPCVSSETTVVLFRLLFPEEDARRKYDMQESRLAQQLTNALGISSDDQGRALGLRNWNAETSTGCLGQEVLEVLRASASNADFVGPLSMLEVDSLLDQLASLSPYSHESVRIKRTESSDLQTRYQTLRNLLSSMPPLDAAFLVQIILKDLRPLLYPLTTTHYTAALKQYKSNAVTMLTISDALRAWDPSLRLLRRWKVASRFEEALEDGQDVIKIFTPLQIPKTVKGTGCAHALRIFSGASKVWAEIKYDGERAQIHVRIDPSTGSPEIKIFSKSKRDSTQDRAAIHPVIKSALGLSGQNRVGMKSIEQDIIIEAEMVAFSEFSGRIDEFWRIRSLIESTAEGPRGKWKRRPSTVIVPDSQCSLLSNASDEGNRHLALVFFDVLYLDSVSLASTPYHARRKLLESLVLPVPGFSMLAERFSIDLDAGVDTAQSELRALLARVLSDHQEGLVLKADHGHYIRSPWVKLKKDYIPSLGDCLDVVIIGARWDKDRGRELRVPPSTFTTFYLALVANEDTLSEEPDSIPHFEAFFTVSYGLSRDQLEDLNFTIKSSNAVAYDDVRQNPEPLGYTFNMFNGIPTPEIMLKKDALLLTEIFGAGFTKAPQCKFYELRFPRMTKVFRRSERSWEQGSSLKEFQRVAREAVGRERPGKEVDDWCKGLWGKPVSPSVKHPLRRQKREDTLLADLEKAEKKRKRGIDDEDEKGLAVRKKQPFSSPPSLESRGIKALVSVINHASAEDARANITGQTQQSMKRTPSPEPPPSPMMTPTRRMPHRLSTLTLNPLPSMISTVSVPIKSDQGLRGKCEAPHVLQNASTSGHPSAIKRNQPTFTDAVKDKRKRTISDVDTSARKKTTLNYRSHKFLSSPTSTDFYIGHTKNPPQLAISRYASSTEDLPSPPPTATRSLKANPTRIAETSATKLTRIPTAKAWVIPPPPPPGALGWHPSRSSGSIFGNSDRITAYNSSNTFYKSIPHLQNRTRSPSIASVTVSSPCKPVESSFTEKLSMLTSITPRNIFAPQELLFANTAIGKLLASSVVWFARDIDAPGPTYRPSWGQLVPQTNRVTRLDALLVGCGWHMNKNFKSKRGAERGLVIIDFEDEGDIKGHVKMASIVKKCEGTWEQMQRWKGGETMKPIWVIDGRALRWDILESLDASSDLNQVERFILWKQS